MLGNLPVFWREGHRRLVFAAILALGLAATTPAPAGAGVVAEGTYTLTAPLRAQFGFRAVLTPTGARIVPSEGETIVISYPRASALVLDPKSRSYFPLPLELLPSLLAAGLGYDPRTVGATATGKSRDLLGRECSEVVVSGRNPKLSLRTWRTSDPAWAAEYARLEEALRLPWTAGTPPPVFVGMPLAGSLEIEGRNPYRASWVITKLARDDRAAEDFSVPAGYQIDLARLLSAQGRP